MIFYSLSVGQIAAPLIAIAVLAATGLVAVGTLFSAMAVNTWFKLLLAFDIVFVAACTLIYPFTVED